MPGIVMESITLKTPNQVCHLCTRCIHALREHVLPARLSQKVSPWLAPQIKWQDGAGFLCPATAG
jgi:hypothetical protein